MSKISTYEARFDISDVTDLLGIERLSSGNSYGVVCPFCGDKRGKMNFRIFKEGSPSNTYHCFNCGAKGNMLTLYAEMKGIYGEGRYKTAYREILKNCAGVDTSHHLNRQFNQPVKESEQPQADLDKRSEVYMRLLNLLTLSPEHERKLLNRGLTKERIIEFQFRSTPVSGTEGLARKLLQEGYSLRGVPGFYLNHHRNWDIAFYRRNCGILCPAYDLNGKIEGFQIRLDEPYDGKKYLWLSSANKSGGSSSKSPVAFFGNPYDRTVRVTEGLLKAAVAYGLSGRSFIGTPGVSQYKGLEKTLSVLKQNGLKEVQEYYDMDKMMDIRCHGDYKEEICTSCQTEKEYCQGICLHKKQKRDQIQSGCRRLYEICRKLDLAYITKKWDCDEDGIWSGNAKGIDDYWWDTLKRKREVMDDELCGEFNNRSNLPADVDLHPGRRQQPHIKNMEDTSFGNHKKAGQTACR